MDKKNTTVQTACWIYSFSWQKSEYTWQEALSYTSKSFIYGTPSTQYYKTVKSKVLNKKTESVSPIYFKKLSIYFDIPHTSFIIAQNIIFPFNLFHYVTIKKGMSYFWAINSTLTKSLTNIFLPTREHIFLYFFPARIPHIQDLIESNWAVFWERGI